jgi:hypothetical protein
MVIITITVAIVQMVVPAVKNDILEKADPHLPVHVIAAVQLTPFLL